MGMVGNQPVRDRCHVADGDLGHYIDMVHQVAHLSGMSLDAAVELVKLAEYARRTRIMVADGDYRDEHIAGICDALKGISEALGDISAAILEQ